MSKLEISNPVRRLARFAPLLLAAAATLLPLEALADAEVQPSAQGVNVDRDSSFRANWSAAPDPFRLDQGVPQFCLRYAGPATGCAGGSVLGRLPAQQDDAPDGFISGYNETLQVPQPIARKALEQFRRGAPATIYFVRRMDPVPGGDIGQGTDRPVFPAVRLDLGGAISSQALLFTSVELTGREGDNDRLRSVIVTEENREDGEIRAEIEYAGQGEIAGWWMVWMAGDPPLRDTDRFTAASLPPEERRLQRGFLKAKRIKARLNPGGHTVLTLAYDELPAHLVGTVLVYPYFGLTDGGVARAGGVTASFPMPVLPLRIEPGAS